MDVDGYEVIKMDFQNLMSCIDCHKENQNLEVLVETLKTITDICSNESCGKDAFREEGGLDFLLNYISSTNNTSLLEHLLKTLTCVIDENIHSQMHMTKIQVFEILQVILKKASFPTTIHRNALLLISAIMYQNSTAQTLIADIGLIQDLLSMYEYFYPSILNASSAASLDMKRASTDSWLSLNSSLCFAVNNPQNEKNQEICSVIFSMALKVMENSLNNVIMCSICSFLSLCISNNVKNQDKFAECDGLLILKQCFQKYFDSLILDAKECRIIIGKGTLQILNSMVGIISAVATDHERNAAVFGRLGMINLMIKLLFVDIIDVQLKTRIMLSLGHCVDACTRNKTYVLETENFDILLKESVQLGNDELTSACMYLLQLCLSNEGFENCIEPSNDLLISSENIRCNSQIPKFESVNQSSPIGVSAFEGYLKKRNIVERTNSSLATSKLKENFDFKCPSNSLNVKNEENYMHLRRNKNVSSRVSHKNSPQYRMQSSNKYEHTSPSSFQQFNNIFSHAIPTAENFKQDSITSNCSKSFMQYPIKKSTFSQKKSVLDSIGENETMGKKHEIPCAVQSPSLSLTDSSSNKSSISQDVHNFIEFSTGITAENNFECASQNKPFKFAFNSTSNADKVTLKKLHTVNKNFDSRKPVDISFASHKPVINSFKFMNKQILSDKTNMDAPCSKFLQNDIRHNLWTFEDEKLYSNPNMPKTCIDNSNFVSELSCSEIENAMIQNDGHSSFEINLEDARPVNSSSRTTTCSHQRSQSFPSQENKLRNLNIAESCKSATTSCSKRKRKRKQLPISSSSQKKSHRLKPMSDSGNYMRVAVLPGETCEEHGLIASFELLKVVPVDDA